MSQKIVNLREQYTEKKDAIICAQSYILCHNVGENLHATMCNDIIEISLLI